MVYDFHMIFFKYVMKITWQETCKVFYKLTLRVLEENLSIIYVLQSAMTILVFCLVGCGVVAVPNLGYLIILNVWKEMWVIAKQIENCTLNISGHWWPILFELVTIRPSSNKFVCFLLLLLLTVLFLFIFIWFNDKMLVKIKEWFVSS